MIQVLLCGTRAPWDGSAITIWAPNDVSLGDRIKWNGCPWRVSAVYSTRFSTGVFAKKREKPNEGPLEHASR